MTFRPALEIVLAHGGNTVRLRPTLRAAVQLERLHDGFATLFQKLSELDTRTVAGIITATATDPEAARRFCLGLGGWPLHELSLLVQGPLLSLCQDLLPVLEDQDQAEPATTEAKPSSTWNDAFRKLYGYGTGWLGWTPAETWEATPTEIADAFAAHTDKLKAIHGAAEDQEQERDALGRTKDELARQRAQNLEDGLDPDFDRAAFAALKHKLMGG